MTLGPLTPLLPSFHAVRLVCAANDVFRIQKLDEKSLHAAVLGKKKTCIYIKPVLSTPSKENLPSLVTACFSISVPYEVACLSQNRGLRLCRKPTICVRKRFNRDCKTFHSRRHQTILERTLLRYSCHNLDNWAWTVVLCESHGIDDCIDRPLCSSTGNPVSLHSLMTTSSGTRVDGRNTSSRRLCSPSIPAELQNYNHRVSVMYLASHRFPVLLLVSRPCMYAARHYQILVSHSTGFRPPPRLETYFFWITKVSSLYEGMVRKRECETHLTG